ncbi:putative reverse transcriptase domain-containing protein [Tanacetum coccineum]
MLKDNLCDTPILSLPDGSKEFIVYCDASNQGLGCVLMQRGKVENATAEMLHSLDQLMERKEGGGIYLLWVSLIGDVRTLMIDEAHASRYLVHSGADKTYYDLRDMYGGHVRRRILLPMLPRSSSGYDTNWVIVDRLTKVCTEDFKMGNLARLYTNEIVTRHEVHVSIISYRGGRFTSRLWSHVLWAEIGEIRSIGPELVQETTNKVILIKEKLKAARDCQKSYVGNMRKHLELKLKYLADTNLHVHLEEIKVDKTLRFVEEPVEIIDREVKSLKRSRIPIVKSIGTRSEIVCKILSSKLSISDSLLLTPLCCDDIHDVTPRVSALAGCDRRDFHISSLQGEVWTLVELPNGKRAIGTKWVFRNKKDERGIVIKNKARLVAQWYTQEERIDYDEFFAHVTIIEAISLFLAYASFKDFMVYRWLFLSALLMERLKWMSKLSRKSTTGGCQFLGCIFISWQCKKQTMVANSTTEAEYVIYIDNESTICIVKNPVFHLKIKHIEIRHHFIRDSNEKKLIQMIKLHTDKNVTDLLTKAFDVEPVVDEVIHKERGDSVERAVTIASSLEVEQDSGMKRLFKIGRSARVISSDEDTLGDQEDASKQGRKITDIDQDAEQSEKVVEEVFSTAEVSAATTITTKEIILAQALAALKSAKPNVDKGRIVRIKSLPEVTTVKVCVTAAKHKLVLLVILMKNMLSINAACTKVTTVGVKGTTAGRIYTDREEIKDLSEKR